MPSTTPNMGLTLPYESDYYDISVFNDNFTKIDGFPYVVESGQTTAYRSNANASVAQYEKITWYYKKWSDGTLEAYAVAHVTGLLCNDKEKQDGTWRSPYIRFYYPSLGQKVIFNRGAWLSQADNDVDTVWLADVSQAGEGNDNLSYQSIRCVTTTQETVNTDKNIYLSFKATWK